MRLAAMENLEETPLRLVLQHPAAALAVAALSTADLAAPVAVAVEISRRLARAAQGLQDKGMTGVMRLRRVVVVAVAPALPAVLVVEPPPDLAAVVLLTR